MKKLLMAVFTVFLSFNVSAEIGADISPDQIFSVRIHTTNHSISPVRKIATIKISGLESGCVSGVFFDSEENAATLSVALSAYVSKSNIRIGYEPNVTAPWGDTKYCALTYLDIK